MFMAGKVCFSYVSKKNRSSPTTSLNTKEVGERLTIGRAGRFCASQAGPDRSGRLSRAEYPRAPSTDIMAVFFAPFGISRLFLSQFPERAQSPDSWAGCPTRMDPSAACTTSRLQNFTFPTCQCPNVKRCFNLAIACSQTSSPPPAISSTATPTMPWYFCCVFLKTRTHGPKTDVSNPRRLAVARKQFLHSLVPSASPLTVFSSCTQTPRDSPRTPSGGIRTKSGSFRLIGSPVLNACCASQNCSLSVTAHRL